MEVTTNLLLLITIIGWGLGGIFQKLSVQRVGAPLSILVFYTVTFILCSSYYFFIYRGARFFDWHGASWGILAGLASGSASIAFVTLLQGHNISSIIGITACNPIITFMVAVFILGEPFTLNRLIGLILVLLGILFIR